jgi:hypothetical protein
MSVLRTLADKDVRDPIHTPLAVLYRPRFSRAGYSVMLAQNQNRCFIERI